MAEGTTRKVALFVQDGEVCEFYDQEEIFENCTVQVLTNTISGRTSVGWWQNKMDETDRRRQVLEELKADIQEWGSSTRAILRGIMTMGQEGEEDELG